MLARLLEDLPSPEDEWPTDAEYAVGHLAGICFGLVSSEEIGHCVGLILNKLEQNATE